MQIDISNPLSDASVCKALYSQGVEVLLLGCAGLTGFVQDLQVLVEMPVIDPVESGCRLLQTLVDSGLNTSHIGLYSKPAPQRMRDLNAVFSDDMAKVLSKSRRRDERVQD